jgi:hypothetical protein
MTKTEFERRIAALERQRLLLPESSIVLELPEKAYQPLYPAQPAARRLYREIPDTSE